MSFFGLLDECTDIGAGLCFKITIVDYVLSWLIGDDCMHGIVKGRVMRGLGGGSEEGVVEGASIVEDGNGLFGGIDVIVKLINLEIALGFVRIVSGTVVEGSP